MPIVIKSSRVTVSPGIDENKANEIESSVKAFVDILNSEIPNKNLLSGEIIKITFKPKDVFGYHDVIDEVTTILVPDVGYSDAFPSDMKPRIESMIQSKLGQSIVKIITPVSQYVGEFIMFNVQFIEKSAIMPFPGTEVEE